MLVTSWDTMRWCLVAGLMQSEPHAFGWFEAIKPFLKLASISLPDHRQAAASAVLGMMAGVFAALVRRCLFRTPREFPARLEALHPIDSV